MGFGELTESIATDPAACTLVSLAGPRSFACHQASRAAYIVGLNFGLNSKTGLESQQILTVLSSKTPHLLSFILCGLNQVTEIVHMCYRSSTYLN